MITKQGKINLVKTFNRLIALIIVSLLLYLFYTALTAESKKLTGLFFSQLNLVLLIFILASIAQCYSGPYSIKLESNKNDYIPFNSNLANIGYRLSSFAALMFLGFAIYDLIITNFYERGFGCLIIFAISRFIRKELLEDIKLEKEVK